MVAALESGRASAVAMTRAMRKAGIEPDEVDYINAHGTGTPLNDRAETAAIKPAFGEHAKKLAVSSTKSMHGHLMGGAGALEAIAAIQAIAARASSRRRSTTKCRTRTATSTTCPNVARHAEVRVALSNSVGLGGHNACVIFRRWDE